MSKTEPKEENINLILRIKAKTEKEINSKNSKFFSPKITNSKSISITSEKGQTKEFVYDYIADEKSTQKEIFENCAKKICNNCLEGYNGQYLPKGKQVQVKLILY